MFVWKFLKLNYEPALVEENVSLWVNISNSQCDTVLVMKCFQTLFHLKIWMIYLICDTVLQEWDVFSPSPLLLCDNISATYYMAANSVMHSRTKHIGIDHQFIREKVAQNQLSVHLVQSEDQLADDIMTEGLHSPRFYSILEPS